ncbi:MAG: F0F1 ATP synthase subunit gamma [Proteobacteria bacterium]|nr:F0F1 ATP synthase subunit gamma [Pseudomonadota bacterium]MBU1689060.1 F0F1 ATP synthase subunit gamma [Pseudomonadota bacterium]
METMESLGRKIKTSHDLLSVVKTMKSLAAVNIRQYEAAAEAMDGYIEVIEKGWQVFFKNRPLLGRRKKVSQSVFLVIGSDQGMCGQFNENIIRYALAEAGSAGLTGFDKIYWSAGDRLRAGLVEEVPVQEHYGLPSSPGAIGDLMYEIIEKFADLHDSQGIETFHLFYNRLEKGATYDSTTERVLPLAPQYGDEKRRESWPNRCLPMIGVESSVFFEQLFQQHIFGMIFKAFSQSLASENAARLAAMQAAEKNILEMEERLQGRFRETRQNTITAELLDIISGFEALSPA